KRTRTGQWDRHWRISHRSRGCATAHRLDIRVFRLAGRICNPRLGWDSVGGCVAFDSVEEDPAQNIENRIETITKAEASFDLEVVAEQGGLGFYPHPVFTGSGILLFYVLDSQISE